MEEAVLVTALALFTLLAAVCSIVFNKLKLPPLIGYIVAGIILVNVLFLYQDHETIEAEEEIISILKDMGLITLMFCIGLEINIKKIKKQGGFAILVAAIQLPLMVLGGFIGGMFLGFDFTQCIVLGAIISGSSTAVVMAVLKSQGRMDKEHIEMLVLITIMEDIGQVIILSMITPLMANYGAGSAGGMDLGDIIALIVKILAFMIISIIVGLKVVPRLVNWISDKFSDEILTVASIGLAFGMALLAMYAGLSMAIGSFLMGMMIASSRKAKEINHKIEPMRDLFMAIFFIGIGAEVYPATMLLDNLGTIVIFYLLFAVLKTVTVFLAYWVGNESCRNGFLSATALCAMGEFAFIIAAEALSENVVDQSFYTSVIGAALISMIMLPMIARYAERIWDRSVEKCPNKLMDRFISINEFRSRIYNSISATSKKSQKAMVRSLAHNYISVLIIVAIEIAFYFALIPMANWFGATFGGNIVLWQIAVLGLNFLVLMIPTYYLITNVKFLDEMVVTGARHIANRRGNKSKSVDVYSSFMKLLEVNTYTLIIAIDFIIVLIVPNSIDVPFWYYLIILAIAVVVVLLVYFKRRSDKESADDDDEYEEIEAAE